MPLKRTDVVQAEGRVRCREKIAYADAVLVADFTISIVKRMAAVVVVGACVGEATWPELQEVRRNKGSGQRIKPTKT